MVARTALALVMLALVVLAGATAVDDARERAEANGGLNSDQQNVSDATEDITSTSFELLQVLIYPLAAALVLGGVGILART